MPYTCLPRSLYIGLVFCMHFSFIQGILHSPPINGRCIFVDKYELRKSWLCGCFCFHWNGPVRPRYSQHVSLCCCQELCLFNDTASYWDYMVQVARKWVWSNGGMILTGENRSTQKILFQCHFVHHKYHMEWPENEPGPPRWEVFPGSRSAILAVPTARHLLSVAAESAGASA